MATITLDGSVTLDESSGLQNSGTAVSGEDNNDSDVSLATLQTGASGFYARLFDAGQLNLDDTFALARGVAKSGDNFITVSNGNLTSLGFVDGDGDALPVYDPLGLPTDGVATGMEAIDGGAIYLFADASLGDRMALGVDEDGDIVFAVFLDPTTNLSSAKVWMVQFEAISNPDAGDPDDPVDLFDSLGVAAGSSIEFDFTDLPSGQNLFGIIAGNKANLDGPALLVIGSDVHLKAADGTFVTSGANKSDTINTSKGGGPVTIGNGNQMFDPGEGAYFVYLNDPADSFIAGVTNGLDQNEADDGDNIQFGGTIAVSAASVEIVQVQGNSPVTMQISAWLADPGEVGPGGSSSRDFALNPTAGADQVNVTAVQVFNAAGILVESWVDSNLDGVYEQPLNNAAVHVVFNQDSPGIYSATVSGLGANFKVAFVTETPHDIAQVEDIAGAFDIGGFNIDQALVTPIDIGDRLRFEDGGLGAAGQDPIPLEEDDLDNLQAVGNNEDLSVNKHTDTGTVSALLFPDVDVPATFSLTADGIDDLPALTSNGEAVTYDITDGTLTAFVDAGGAGLDGGDRVVFTFVLADNGDYTFTLIDQLDHVTGNGENTLLAGGVPTIDLSPVIQASDEDGDSITAPGVLEFEIQDDVPVLTGETEDAVVEEDDLANANSTGNNEDDSIGKDVATGTLSGLVTVGTDEDATFSLGDTSGLPALTSKGDAITYVVDGDTLTATADEGGDNARTVFTLQVLAIGSYTFTLLDQLDHTDDGLNDENTLDIDLSSIILATDFDGDAIGLDPDTFTVTVEDDVPLITAQIDSAVVDFEDGDSASNSLNGSVGSDENDASDEAADGTKTYTFDTALIGSSSIADLQSQISDDGTTAWFFTDGDSVGNVAGEFDGNDTLWFSNVLGQDGAGSYTFTAHQPPPDAVIAIDFQDLPSGQNLFGIVAADKADPQGLALLAIGSNVILTGSGTFSTGGSLGKSDTINTSKGGGPVTIGNGNQMIDLGEGVYFAYLTGVPSSFVSGITNGLDQNEADDADNIQFGGTMEFTTAQVEVVQLQGGGLATMMISAFDIDIANVDTTAESRAFALDPEATDNPVEVISVKVFDAAGNLLEDTDDLAHFDHAAIEVDFSGLTAEVSGVNSGYTIEFTTDAPHDLALVTGVGGKFDIGGFNFVEGVDTPDQRFDFSVEINDFDGDTDGGSGDAFANFSVGVDGTGEFDDGTVSFV